MGVLMADSCLADTAVLLTSLVLLAYYWSVCTFSYWRDRGVKTVAKTTPLLGSLTDAMLLRRHFGLHYTDMYHELEGERFGGYFKLRQPAILLRDPELIKLVVLKDFNCFSDTDIHATAENNPMFAYNLFGMKGSRWKYARSKLSPVYSSGKIRAMFPQMLEICDELKTQIQENIDNGNSEFEAQNLAIRYTTDVVGLCAFALKLNSLKDDNNEFRKISRELMGLSHLGGFFKMLWFLYPGKGDYPGFFGVKYLSNHINDFFRRLLNDAMEFREKNGVQRNDLVQFLMNIKQQEGQELENEGRDEREEKTQAANGKFRFPADLLTAQALGIYFDGAETSSLPLAFALFELAANPPVQARLRGALRARGGGVAYEVVGECPYLDCVVRETLRKYPVAGVLSKTCTQRYQLPGTDVTLEVGTPVSIPVHALHHDPQYYPDPETFDPERFNEENKKNRVAYTFLPFGEGPRQCIGMRFALAQIKAALATIILNFEVTRSDKTQHPVVLDPTNFMTSAVGGLHVNMKPLTD